MRPGADPTFEVASKMQPVTADTGAVICENRRAEMKDTWVVWTLHVDETRAAAIVVCVRMRMPVAAILGVWQTRLCQFQAWVLWYRPTTKFSDFNGIPYLSEGEIAKFDPIVLRRV